MNHPPTPEMGNVLRPSVGLLGVVLPGIAELLSRPNPLPNVPDYLNPYLHGGNMMWGSTIALTAATAAVVYNDRVTAREQGEYIPPVWDQIKNPSGFLPDPAMRKFRQFGTPAIMGVVGAVNLACETKWGVSHLPFAELLGGRTPDSLDTAFSMVWAGITANLMWMRGKRPTS